MSGSERRSASLATEDRRDGPAWRFTACSARGGWRDSVPPAPSRVGRGGRRRYTPPRNTATRERDSTRFGPRPARRRRHVRGSPPRPTRTWERKRFPHRTVPLPSPLVDRFGQWTSGTLLPGAHHHRRLQGNDWSRRNGSDRAQHGAPTRHPTPRATTGSEKARRSDPASEARRERRIPERRLLPDDVHGSVSWKRDAATTGRHVRPPDARARGPCDHRSPGRDLPGSNERDAAEIIDATFTTGILVPPAPTRMDVDATHNAALRRTPGGKRRCGAGWVQRLPSSGRAPHGVSPLVRRRDPRWDDPSGKPAIKATPFILLKNAWPPSV